MLCNFCFTTLDVYCKNELQASNPIKRVTKSIESAKIRCHEMLRHCGGGGVKGCDFSYFVLHFILFDDILLLYFVNRYVLFYGIFIILFIVVRFNYVRLNLDLF